MHYFKDTKEFLKFCLSLKDMKEVATFFEQAHFKVIDSNDFHNEDAMHSAATWMFVSSAYCLKELSMLCEELQNV